LADSGIASAACKAMRLEKAFAGGWTGFVLTGLRIIQRFDLNIFGTFPLAIGRRLTGDGAQLSLQGS
jgi:hypothetical protein